MNKAEHPFLFLNQELVQTLRSFSAEAEHLRKLHPGQLAAIYRHKWFNLYVPHAYDGLELSLPDALKIEEGLAWVDGSIGWTVTLCSGANWFIGFLQPLIADRLFSVQGTCLAGSGRASGTAKLTEDGYIVNGSWQYATGAPFASAFTANCLIEKDDRLLYNEDGSVQTMAFVFLREEVSVHNTWSLSGMVATGSYSFAVHELKLAHNRSFHITPAAAVLPQPVYQYPFLQFAEATLVVNISGMAYRFLELCEPIFAEKIKHMGQTKTGSGSLLQKLEDAFLQLTVAREQFYTAVTISWNSLLVSSNISVEQLEQVSSSSRALALIARQLTDQLYPYCGLIAANLSTEINRVWRNLHTASQHTLLNFPL